MKILYTSDTHVYPPYLARLLKAADHISPEAIIIGGDLIPDWRGSIQASIEPHRAWVRDHMLPLLRAFRKANGGVKVLLDLGNDDIAAAQDLLAEGDGVDLHLLHMRLVELSSDLVVAGYMNVNPTPFRIKDREKPDCRDHTGLLAHGVTARGSITSNGAETPHLLDPRNGAMEDDLDSLSQALADEARKNHLFIFVSHAPPKDTALDCTSSDLHVGSLAVRRFIQKWAVTGRLTASLHGHIHESPWMTGRVWQDLDGAPCFNVGQKPKRLRALLFDTEQVRESARLVLVDRAGEASIMKRNEWLLEQ